MKETLYKTLRIRSIKRRVYLFLVNYIFVGTKYFEIKRILLNAIGFKIGEGTKIVGPIECYGTLAIGTNCWIGKNLIINGNGAVIIGDNCDLAPEITFLTGGHKIGTYDRRAGRGEQYTIEIGNGVWIGARSTLVNNISIGDGAVIAACACVNKSIGCDLLVGGVPARTIKVLEHDETNTKDFS